MLARRLQGCREGHKRHVVQGPCAPTGGESRFSPLARVGPTTPTRARRLADASVDHTEASNSRRLPLRKRSKSGRQDTVRTLYPTELWRLSATICAMLSKRAPN